MKTTQNGLATPENRKLQRGQIELFKDTQHIENIDRNEFYVG